MVDPAVSPIEPFSIDDEVEALAYLNDLLKREEYRSMDEVERRAWKYIKDCNLRVYFINKAKEILKSS
jgi:hypothetical protein